MSDYEAYFFPKRSERERLELEKRWQQIYFEVMEAAEAVMKERGEDYNRLGIMPDYFEHPHDLFTIWELKMRRIENDLVCRRDPLESVRDLVNYVAYIRPIFLLGFWDEYFPQKEADDG